jgi:hypothetical protein
MHSSNYPIGMDCDFENGKTSFGGFDVEMDFEFFVVSWAERIRGDDDVVDLLDLQRDPLGGQRVRNRLEIFVAVTAISVESLIRDVFRYGFDDGRRGHDWNRRLPCDVSAPAVQLASHLTERDVCVLEKDAVHFCSCFCSHHHLSCGSSSNLVVLRTSFIAMQRSGSRRGSFASAIKSK